tara:strand:- start:4751 stop:5113 length:363 start_codon:yes stop_codon:yes gene_type:complete
MNKIKIINSNKVKSEAHNEEHGGMDVVYVFTGTVEYDEAYNKKGTWKSLWFPTRHTRKTQGVLKVKTQYWGMTAARITRWVWWNGDNIQSSELPFDVDLGSLFGEVSVTDFTNRMIKEFC